MMMPANFSAIAENELTYVVGGSAATDFAKTLNTNLVTIVGNSYVGKLVSVTLGTMFGGAWGADGAVSMSDAMSNAFFKVNGKDMNGFNKFLSAVGIGAAIYQLGAVSTPAANGKVLKWYENTGDEDKTAHYLGLKGWFSNDSDKIWWLGVNKK